MRHENATRDLVPYPTSADICQARPEAEVVDRDLPWDRRVGDDGAGVDEDGAVELQDHPGDALHLDDSDAVALIKALDSCWSAIQRFHPDVPKVMLLMAPADSRSPNVLGHFWALRWSGRQNGTFTVHEVVVVAEHLVRGAVDIMGTLLHEAAHAMNCARDIKDCSNNGYHNAKFKDAAEELGLSVMKATNYGFAYTAMPPATAQRYRSEIEALSSVCTHRKPRERRGLKIGVNVGVTEAHEKNRHAKAMCGCGTIIRMARRTLAQRMVYCRRCEEPFRAQM